VKQPSESSCLISFALARSSASTLVGSFLVGSPDHLRGLLSGCIAQSVSRVSQHAARRAESIESVQIERSPYQSRDEGPNRAAKVERKWINPCTEPLLMLIDRSI